MHIVYILRSRKHSNRHYVGICRNLNARLVEHNAGECKSTALSRPWLLQTALYFSDPSKASAFERYLKTGSGRAFANRHL